MCCHVTVTTPIMGHKVIFKLFGEQYWHIFSQLQITFEGRGWGSEGFILAKYHAELDWLYGMVC
jgi:hypothetical protein